MARTAARSVTSTHACVTLSSPWVFRFICATSEARSPLISAKQTIAPSSSSASAIARPIPCAAPVTIHDRPETRPIGLLLYLRSFLENERMVARGAAAPQPNSGSLEDRLREFVHVVLSDLRCVEVVQERKFFTVEQINCGLQGRFCVIDRRLIDGTPVGACCHHFVTDCEVCGTNERDAVNAVSSDRSVHCAYTHVVITGINTVDIVILHQESFHDLL